MAPPDQCGGKLSNSKSLPPPPPVVEAFKIIFFNVLQLSQLICIQMCANISGWVEPAKRWTPHSVVPVLCEVTNRGFCLLLRDTIGYGEFTTAINPSNGSCTLLQWTMLRISMCLPQHLRAMLNNVEQCLPHLRDGADCETINYLTSQ